MWGVIGRVCVAVWMGCFTVAAGQLPPDVMVDKYLLQARMLSEEKDHAGALEAMDQIVSLQKKHDLTLPEAFSFQYAQTALAAGSVQAAIDSANRYLTAAGREGKHYREALELLVKAERRLQEPAVDRVGSTPVKPEIEPQPQAVLPASTQTQKTAKARPVPDCGQWNTMQYFQAATVESVTACLAAGADPMARNYSKYTPLHFVATYNKNPAVIEALLEAGADPMARDIYKYTPLYYAAEYNRNPAVTERLIKAGASLSAQNEWGRTSLQEAVVFNAESESKKTTKAHLVVDCRKWNTKKFFRKATVEDVRACINAGVNLDARDGGFLSDCSKCTPLHRAAMHNENVAVIEALLKAGADPMAWTFWKSTPLHRAARHNENVAVIEALLKAGADLEALNENNHTPLSLANKHNKNPSVRQAFLAAGAGRVESQMAAAKAQRKAPSGGGGGWAALVAGVAGGAIASASGLDAATATELGATIAGSVLADEAVGSSGTGAASGGTSGNTGATAGGGPCQVPGYPNPPGGVSNLGFSWCPASVSLQVRSFALQAAGAECAIATGSSSTPEQIEARRREIRAACDRLSALGQGNCQCPAGLGQ